MNQKYPTALVILDGWGFSEQQDYNAIAQANPTMFNFLWDHYPHALLRASGKAVGLPDNIAGNSEVGHLTIGAGKVILQPITLINNAIKNNEFEKNENLKTILETCREKNGRLHLLGLLSDGMVHSNIEHLFALIHAANTYGIPHIFVHAFLDGRDVAPRSAEHYLTQLQNILKNNPNAQLGSIGGRFYAMDRNENWDRTAQYYTMLTHESPVSFDTIPNGITQDERQQDLPLVVSVHHSRRRRVDVSNHTSNWQTILQENYTQGISDEFIPPSLLKDDARICDNDTLIFFNIRPDRMRQIVSLFLQKSLPAKKNNSSQPLLEVPQNLTIASMIRYHKDFTNTILIEKRPIQNTLLDTLELHKKTIFTIAETEKYAHITYFFNGGKETQRTSETRVLIPSPDVTTYDATPCMSAPQITQAVVQSLRTNPCDFYLINYANADMLGHTGNFEKTKEAIVCLDEQLKMLYKTLVEEFGGTLYITSDHGNAEQMWDEKNNCIKTSHTNNPVPFIMIRKDLYHKKSQSSLKLTIGELAEIAPLIIERLPW